jgi:hypothetical protein
MCKAAREERFMMRTGKAGIVMALAALVVPVMGYAVGRSQVPAAAIRPATAQVRFPARRLVPSMAGCRGLGYGVIPARGDIGNPDGTEGGSLRWRTQKNGHVVCIGTVRMWVRYPVREYAHWLIGICGLHAMPAVIGDASFTIGPGSYYRYFRVDRQFRGPFFLCLIASFGAGPRPSAGMSCLRLG